MSYTELQVTTNFSFLRGASHPEEFVEQADRYGYGAIGIADRNTLAGLVRAHGQMKEREIRVIPGCRLDLQDGPSLLVYPVNKAAYTSLTKLLTTGNLRAEKGSCHLYGTDLDAIAGGVKAIAVPPRGLDAGFDLDPAFEKSLLAYRNLFGRHLYLAASRPYFGQDAKWLHRLHDLSKRSDVPLVATNDVHYHVPERRELQDVLTCVREKCTIQTAGFRLHQNAERHLKPAEEMIRLFRDYPDAIRRTQEIAEACGFSLASLRYQYPRETTREGRSPQEELAVLVREGMRERFPPDRVFKTMSHAAIEDTIRRELAFIEEMDYASYFLTVYDIVRFARDKHILCQGRGSAANSLVCYCLGITSVDPDQIQLLFERFISSARNEPPDIDVDFEHERREEVIQYIYEKYGRDRAAIVATVTQERQRGAIRDVGKAMGLSADMIARLSNSVWEFSEAWLDGKTLSEQGFDPQDPYMKKILSLTGQLMGFPRQLGQHTGGFVITDGQLTDLCPILNARMENRTCIEWNKDDIDILGFLKVDVLGLGMLTCLRKAFDLLLAHYGVSYTLVTVPQEDPDVYEMIGHADTIGVFQIESRAQQAMLPRLKPVIFYDLVIEVAIVRPGPIQGDMVHPYLRRRSGLESVDYPSKDLERILERTKGVPLFQEQAMQIAIVAAGFSPAEADDLRRSMATFKAPGKVAVLKQRLVNGMIKKGYSPEYAARIFRQLEGFGSYGFPESHAASFALLVYVSAWLKCHYPDVFGCALLNSQPMGFYAPSQLVSDARRHGVNVRPVDINRSYWDNTLEERAGKFRALRLGFRQVKGLAEEDMGRLAERRAGGYASIDALRDAGIPQTALEKLADADAFRSIGLDRRQALWQVSASGDRPFALFEGQPSDTAFEPQPELPFLSLGEHVVEDYAATSLSLKAHPVAFVRAKLESLRVTACQGLAERHDGDRIRVAGLVLVRQRPGTASGICFITIEDETGTANLVVWESLFEKYRKEILGSKLLMVEGRLQIEGEVIHVVVDRCHNLSSLLRVLGPAADGEPPPTARRAVGSGPKPGAAIIAPEKDGKVFPKGRNFR